MNRAHSEKLDTVFDLAMFENPDLPFRNSHLKITVCGICGSVSSLPLSTRSSAIAVIADRTACSSTIG